MFIRLLLQPEHRDQAERHVAATRAALKHYGTWFGPYPYPQITVVDPEYLTGPWSWTWTYQRKPGYKMYEYVCEDNREFADPDTGAQRMRFKNEGQ